MAELNSRRFDNIYKLLSEHNFAININVPDRLSCAKCRNILVNACQVRCGCRYCHSCIEEMMTTGCEVCPGNTDFCRDEQISNYQIDYSSNREVLQLLVKCPQELCHHECELINMEEHLRLCSNKSVPCPFYGFGCDDDKLIVDKIGDHFQSEGFNHNKILIELIENLRNEVNVLKGSDETNKLEIQRNKNHIEMLIGNSRMKDQVISVIQQDIQSHKSQIELLQEDSRMKDQTISVMQQQIRSIKEEKQQMKQEIPKKKKENTKVEMTKKWRDILGTEVRKMNDDMDKLQLELTKRTDEVEKWQDKQIDGTFVMKIDKISNRRQNGAWTFSPIFYARIRPYKMQFVVSNVACSDELEIQLCIHAGEMDAFMEWPYKENVTIQICNKAHPNSSKSIKKHCQNDKPNNNSYELGEIFQFSFTELSTAGLIQNDYLIVEYRAE